MFYGSAEAICDLCSNKFEYLIFSRTIPTSCQTCLRKDKRRPKKVEKPVIKAVEPEKSTEVMGIDIKAIIKEVYIQGVSSKLIGKYGDLTKYTKHLKKIDKKH